MMVINNKFNIEDIVYLKTDEGQKPRIVVQISARKNDLLYELNLGSSGSWHNEFEITSEKNILKNICED
jgi:hypothetical protein